MGSSDLNDNNGGVPLQGGSVQPLVRRLQISPPAEFVTAASNPENRKAASDFAPTTNTVRTADIKIGLISQIRAAGNFKNTPISRRLTTLTRGPVAISAVEHQRALRKISRESNRPPLADAQTEDLVNLLVRPDGALLEQRLSWYLLPLLPFRYLGEWIKHIVWLSARVFPWKYPRVAPSKIINSDTVQLAITKTCEREAAQERCLGPLTGGSQEVVSKNARYSHARRARKMLDTIAANTSVVILRIASVVVNRIFMFCLSGIYVRRDLVDELRSLSLANPGVPVVYLPLHRSHLDYILLTYILWLHDMRLPQVAAGDNIALPVFNFLLRGLGAFFIRRRIDRDDDNKRNRTNSQSAPSGKDYVYRGVLQEYMCELLAMGHSMEFYMEGGRSRNGRTLSAKGGLLSVLLHAYQTRAVKDVIIVPGAVTYDKLFDGNFVEEQRGLPKTKETFGGAIRSIWGVMCSQFGSVRMEFGKPFTLKSFLEENAERFDLHQEFDFSEESIDNDSVDEKPHRSHSSASLVNAAPEDQHKINRLTKCLATQVLCASTSARALSGPNLVAFLLMTRFRTGCQESDLVSALQDLCILLRSSPCSHPLTFTDLSTSNLSQIIRYSEWLFPHLMTIRTSAPTTSRSTSCKGTISASSQSESASNCAPQSERFVWAQTDSINVSFELQYLANPVAEALLGEAILAAALLAVREEQQREQRQPNQADAAQRQFRTSEMTVLAYVDEDDLRENEVCPIDLSSVERVVAELCDILEFEFVYLQEPRETVRKLENAKAVLVQEGLLLVGDENRLPSIRCDPTSIQRLEDLRSGIAHLIEGYHTVAMLLCELRSSPPQLCERCLGNECLRNALSKCQKGLVEYPEGCSKDVVQNAVKLFSRWGVLVPAHSPNPSTNDDDQPEARRNFFLGEQSSVDDNEMGSPSQTQSLVGICSAKKCSSTPAAGADSSSVKISDEWRDKLSDLVAKLRKFRTPAECQ